MLKAVEELVLEVGARNLSLRAVARRAGVSHASPGHHFGDKDGMLAAFAQRGFEKFAEAMSKDEAGMLNGEAYVRFALENQAYYDVMFRSGLDPTCYSGLEEGARGTYGSLLAAVEAIQAKGVMTDVEPEILAVHLWSLVHGLASLLIDNQIRTAVSETDRDTFIRSVLQIGVP